MKITRRKFLKRVIPCVAGGCLTIAGVLGYSLEIEPQWLTIEKVQIPLKNLNPALTGFKIAQLSDIHLSSSTQIDFVKTAVNTVNTLQPDLIVLTGDYVFHSANFIFELAPVLAHLKAPYGVFCILGNHDAWLNKTMVQAGLEHAGLPVLRNEGVTLRIGQTKLYLAGLNAHYKDQPDLNAALAKRPAEDIPTILLAHEPDLADMVAADGRVSLQLSGHSHGGQVRLPFIGAPVLPYLGRKYDQGLYRVKKMWLYTNRGLGNLVPIRFNCRPEITEFTLVEE